MDSAYPQGRTSEPDSLPGSGWPGPDSYLVDWRTSLRMAERACCCPSRPAVVVIMPSAAGRASPSELLLCRHHYTASERSLADRYAAVFDTDGAPLTDLTRALVQAGAAADGGSQQAEPGPVMPEDAETTHGR
jgi:hypothetical protein